MSAKANSRGKIKADIVIRQHDGICVVEPRKFRTARGKTVTFQNLTGDRIQIFFPEVELFKELKQEGPVIPFSNKEIKRLTVGTSARDALETKADNHFHYAVHCRVFGEFAIANSNPIIIVSW